MRINRTCFMCEDDCGDAKQRSHHVRIALYPASLHMNVPIITLQRLDICADCWNKLVDAHDNGTLDISIMIRRMILRFHRFASHAGGEESVILPVPKALEDDIAQGDFTIECLDSDNEDANQLWSSEVK